MDKKMMLKSFKDNTSIEFSLCCAICGEVFTADNEGYYGDTGLDEFSQAAYNEGWRVSSCDYFGHTGIHCLRCHMIRNNITELKKLE